MTRLVRTQRRGLASIAEAKRDNVAYRVLKREKPEQPHNRSPLRKAPALRTRYPGLGRGDNRFVADLKGWAPALGTPLKSERLRRYQFPL